VQSRLWTEPGPTLDVCIAVGLPRRYTEQHLRLPWINCQSGQYTLEVCYRSRGKEQRFPKNQPLSRIRNPFAAASLEQ